MSALVPEHVTLLRPTIKAPPKPRRRKVVKAKAVSRIQPAAMVASEAPKVVELPLPALRQPAEAVEAVEAPREAVAHAVLSADKVTIFRSFDLLAYLIACSLAGIAAWFSLKGLAVLFPGASHEIVVMGAIMEGGKIIGCGWLAANWRHVSWMWRDVIVLLVAGLMTINAAGLFSQLTAAHTASTAARDAAVTLESVGADSKIETASTRLGDLEHQIAGIDAIVAGAAQHGHARTAANVMAEQRKARASLVVERDTVAGELADLKVQRGSVQARAAVAEAEACGRGRYRVPRPFYTRVKASLAGADRELEFASGHQLDPLSPGHGLGVAGWPDGPCGAPADG